MYQELMIQVLRLILYSTTRRMVIESRVLMRMIFNFIVCLDTYLEGEGIKLKGKRRGGKKTIFYIIQIFLV